MRHSRCEAEVEVNGPGLPVVSSTIGLTQTIVNDLRACLSLAKSLHLIQGELPTF